MPVIYYEDFPFPFYHYPNAKNKSQRYPKAVVPLHQFVWWLERGYLPANGMSIDHIDGDKTNVDISNLRELPRGENTSLSTRKAMAEGRLGWQQPGNRAKLEAAHKRWAEGRR